MEKLFNPIVQAIIQKDLSLLTGEDLVSIALRDGATNDLPGAITLAYGLITDNERMANEILGNELIENIKAYVAEHDRTEPKDGAFTD